MKTAIIAFAVLLGITPAALAQTWSPNITFKRDTGASLKITEPDGFTVSIVAGGVTKADTIPAIFALANQAAYVPVTITAKDGQTWTQKVEIRAYHQTELAVKYTAAAAATPAVAGRKYIGQVSNWTHKCKRSEYGQLRFDFMRAGKAAYTFEVAPGKAKANQEVEGGAYDVRVFFAAPGAQAYRFLKTLSYTVSKDGWDYWYGCRR